MNDLNIAPKGLDRKGFQFTLPAAAITAGSFTIPTGRGNVMAIKLIPSNGTLDELNQVIFTLDNNGESVIESDTLAQFSDFYRSDILSVVPTFLKEGGTVQYSYNNPTGKIITVNVVLFFRDPTRPTFINQVR